MAAANVVTVGGRTVAANRLKGLGTEPNFIDWGTSAETAAVTDTAIGTTGGEARVQGTSSIVTTSTTNDTYQVVGTLVAAAAKTITIVALFDAATLGTMFAKASLATGIALNAGDGISWTLKIQLTSA